MMDVVEELRVLREKMWMMRSMEVVDMRRDGELMRLERRIEKLYWKSVRGCV